MARDDLTFSGQDLIRFFVNNLASEEQEDVRCFFFLAERAGRRTKKGFELISKFIIQLFKLSPFGFILDIIDDLVEIFDDPIDVKRCLARVRRIGL